MKTILILGDQGSYWHRSACKDNAVEQEIMYWLGKSPGTCHDIDQILVVDEDSQSFMCVLEKYRKRQESEEKEDREQQERLQLQALKRKYES
jgi:hypothetical protein